MRYLLPVLVLACTPTPPAPDCAPPPPPPECPKPEWAPPAPMYQAKHEVIALGKEYVGEHESTEAFGSAVKYFDPLERERARIVAKDGLLVFVDGKPLDAELKTHPDREGDAIFAMDAAGNLYASFDHTPGYIHHSSMLAGSPVASAGTIKVEQGKLLELTNYSGHYKPPGKTLDHVLAELKALGVPTAKTKVLRFGDE